MITYLKGDLFKSPAQVIVNTVNTVGVMGKGVALEFKKRYPQMFTAYQKVCESKDLDIGKLMLWKSPEKWVLLFPTKRHWRNPSKLEYIEAGLKKFKQSWDKAGIESIAFPRLGCGNGALDWNVVKPLMEKYLRNIPINIFIYVDNHTEPKHEHEDIIDMQRWLASDPQSLGFNALRELLVNKYSNIGSYTLDDGEKYQVQYKNGHLEIHNGEKHSIPEDELCNFWSIIREIGIIQENKLPTEYEAYSRFLLELFKSLGYLETVMLESADSSKIDIKAYQYIKTTWEEYDAKEG